MTEDPRKTASPHADEFAIGRLIRSAGRGPSASSAARERVYAEANAVWQRRVAAKHTRRRRLGWLAAAAAIGGAAILVSVQQTAPDAPAAPAAVLARLTGPVFLVRGGESRQIAAAPALDEILRVGDTLRTAAEGSAALRLPSGLSVRIGGGTAVEFESAGLLDLNRGRVYVDTGGGAEPVNTPFEIVTPLASIEHVGTQYAVYVDDGAVRVRVREGRVGIDAGGAEILSEAGQQIRLTPTAAPERSAIETYGAEWAWVEELASAELADGVAVGELLDWIAHETGRSLAFEDSRAETRARTSTIHGVAGLTPREALEVVSGTTELGYTVRGGTLLVTETRSPE
jgi:hypothetical protein